MLKVFFFLFLSSYFHFFNKLNQKWCPTLLKPFLRHAAFFFFSSAVRSFRSHSRIKSVHRVLKTYLLYRYLTSYNQPIFSPPLLLNWRHFKLLSNLPTLFNPNRTGHFNISILLRFSSFIYFVFIFLRSYSTYQVLSLCYLCQTHRHTNTHILQHMYSTVSWIMLSFFYQFFLFH